MDLRRPPTQGRVSHNDLRARALELEADQTLQTVGAVFQYGGFEITIGEAVYDETDAELFLGVRVRNLTGGWSTPEPSAVVEHADGESILDWQAPTIPSGMAAEATMRASRVPISALEGGTVLWGRKDYERPEIGLDGPGSPLWRPVSFPFDRWAQIGKFTVHITGAAVLQGSLGRNLPAEEGTRILRVDLDSYAHGLSLVNGFYAGEHFMLRRPDGTTVPTLAASEGIGVVEAWTVAAGQWVEFAIPDPVGGDYELLFNSVSPSAMGTFHEDLIEYVPIPFSIADLEPAAIAVEDPPRPQLVAGPPATAAPVDAALDAGAMNVPGFSFEPSRLEWEPAASTAWVEGTATYLQTPNVNNTGLLATTPAFDFNAALVSGGRWFSGIGDGDMQIEPGHPRTIRLEFLGVDALDLRDLGLAIGRKSSVASTLPLSSGSDLPSYPLDIVEGAAISADATAADWTVKVVGYRIGLVQVTAPPPPGYRQLEVYFDVTAAPDATKRAFGLGFSPSSQLFLSGADGYLTRAVGDSGGLAFEQGQTQRMSLTFWVQDTFTRGRLGFVLRGNDDGDHALAGEWVDTTFAADIGGAAAAGLDEEVPS